MEIIPGARPVFVFAAGFVIGFVIGFALAFAI
jgi:hypothetical protein